MATRKVATVFGGSGFLGRYVVKRLAAQGYIVRVAVRAPNNALFLKPMGQVGQVVPLFCNLREPATVQRAADGAALVVNLVGILAERRAGDFQRIQADGAGIVARAAAAGGARALVQVSAIGADPASRSRYGLSKAAGEAAMRSAFPTGSILRPSLVFGPEDQFFNRFAGLGRLLPFMPVICGQTRMQPVYAGDVADAVMAALHLPEAAGGLYELGGPEIFTFRALLAYILHCTRRHRPLVNIPLPLARLQASLAERLPGKVLTRDQLLLLAQDNVVADGAAGLPALGIVPTPVQLVVPEYLRRFQPASRQHLDQAAIG